MTPPLEIAHETFDLAFSLEAWSLIRSVFEKPFGSYWPFIEISLLWTHTEPKYLTPPVIDWNETPPQGYWFDKQFFVRGKRPGQDRGERRPYKERESGDQEDNSEQRDSKESHSESKPHSRPHQEKRHNAHSSEHEEKKEHREHKKSSHHQNNSESETPISAPFKDPSRRQKGFAEQEHDLKEALEEASKALTQLKENPDLESVNLTPRPSLIRMQQHALILDNAGISYSDGEEPTRYIVVKKQNKKKDKSHHNPRDHHNRH